MKKKEAYGFLSKYFIVNVLYLNFVLLLWAVLFIFLNAFFPVYGLIFFYLLPLSIVIDIVRWYAGVTREQATIRKDRISAPKCEEKIKDILDKYKGKLFMFTPEIWILKTENASASAGIIGPEFSLFSKLYISKIILDNLHKEELQALVCHEIGHIFDITGVMRKFWRSVLILILITLVFLTLNGVYLILMRFETSGFSREIAFFSLGCFLAAALCSLLFFQYDKQRTEAELACDVIGAILCKSSWAMERMLMTMKELAEKYHFDYVNVNYEHPSVEERIKLLNKLRK